MVKKNLFFLFKNSSFLKKDNILLEKKSNLFKILGIESIKFYKKINNNFIN